LGNERLGVSNQVIQPLRALKSRYKILPYVPFFYLFLVVYGSLIPFDYRAVPLSEAWSRFLDIPYLRLGVASRADWIANILLYIPLAFLSAAWMEAIIGSRGKVGRMLVVFLGCSLVAVTIEFLQIFFAPRTVSINDIIAELLGVIGGIVLWHTIGGCLARLWMMIATGGRKAIDAVLVLYVALYLVLSLFPFDFLVSLSELSWKLGTPNYHAVIAWGACHDLMRCVVILIVEIIAVLPFGILIGFRTGGRQNHRLSQAVLYGGVFGIVVELSQFFMASGVSQGASVLTRVLGIGLGLWLFPLMRENRLAALKPFLNIGIVFAAISYFLLLMGLNGWFSQGWIGLEEAFFKLNGKMVIPFYYHYFTTETRAMYSLLYNAAIYGPIGLGYWAWCFSRRIFSGSALIAAFFGGSAAAVIETSKLFLVGKHPDFTNLLIAAVATGSTYSITDWISRIWSEPQATSVGSFEA
jgi:VanZ family protein